MPSVIYKATNNQTNQSYIGFATDFVSRKHNHKQRAIKGEPGYFYNAIRTYGWDNFDWEILCENATFDDEIRLIAEHNTHYKNGGYNLTNGGEGWSVDMKHTEETKKKLSKIAKARPLTEERLATLRANAAAMKGRKRPQEICDRISEANKGKPKSAEHRAKMAKTDKSFTQTQEYKDKMSKACKGKPKSEETKLRMKQAAINRWSNKNKAKVI